VENGKNSHDYTAVPLPSLFVQQPDGVSYNCAGGGKKFFKNQITQRRHRDSSHLKIRFFFLCEFIVAAQKQ